MSEREVLVDKDLALLGHNRFSSFEAGGLIVVGSDIGPISFLIFTSAPPFGTESGRG